MAVMDQLVDLQDKMIETVASTQARVIDVTERVAGQATKLPSVDVSKLGFIPGIESAPKPHDLVGNSFDFAGKMLATNRAFVDSMFAAWAPAAEKASSSK